MATHSSVLAWRIPGMGEPGGLPSMGSHSQTRLKQLSSSNRELSSYMPHIETQKKKKKPHREITTSHPLGWT